MPTFPYNNSYRPPAPACQVTLLATRGKRAVGLLHAILDTGADGTLVPQRYLDEIGVRPVMETGLRSQWGERRVVYLHLVKLRIDDIELLDVFVVGDDRSDEIVVGRNMINRLQILLDGPTRVTQLSLP